MKKLNEIFGEETVYVVHSDANENNILQDFDDLAAALEYAKDNIDELTYIEEVVKNSESDEIYSTEVIWSYDEDDAEDQVVCEWCGELEYESNCRRELNLGLLCSQCQSALYSRGEKPVFEEAYDSDYAEGDDIFEQDFEDAPIVSKYKLDNSEEASEKTELKELFGFGKKKKSKNRYILAMSRDTSGRLFTSELWRDICRIVEKHVEYKRSNENYFPYHVLNQIEFISTEDIATKIKNEIWNFLDGLQYQRKYISGTRDHINSDGEVNADITKSAKRLIELECIERNITEAISEEAKLATNKKGDYLVAADSGKGYTVFNRSDARIGGFDGEDDQKAIDRFNKGDINESLVENPVYYHVYEVHSGKTKKVLEKIKYTLTDAIKFAKEHLEEEPFIKDCLYEKESNNKIHDEVVWTAKDNIDDEICFYCRKNASKADLKEVGVRDEHVKLCSNCRWLLGTRRITLRDIADRLPSSRALENPDRLTFQPGVYGNTYVESLKEGLNNSEFAEYMQLCKEIGIKSAKDLESFLNEVGLKYGCPAQDVLQALRDYCAELGPDFKIIHEEVKLSENYAVDNFNIPGFELQVTNEFEDEGVKGFNIIYSKNGVDIVEIEIWELDAPISVIKNLYKPNLMNSMYDSFDGFAADLEYKVERYFTEQLEEGYKIDLPYKKVKEIKDELDLHGDISFDLVEPVEESDEDGWRGASEFIIIETDNGSYEGYYNWLDQDGDIIESGADEYYDNFEELLYAIDDVYVNIIDLDAYIGSQLAEELEEAKNSLNESQSQEISREYNRLSKKYGIDFEELVYGEEGFMKTKYPNNFPDFAGDVIYSERYWNELVDFAKGKGIDLTK